jgi:hypothetical protein
MANKRMFSKQITTSDAFTEMPMSSQLLYFHLNMEADDDGFVSNPKRITKMVGANDDDLKILLAKRFLLSFQSGVVVIKHWLLHNAVRKDMYKETQYLEEKKTLQIKDNNVYTEVRNESVTSPLHRLDKDRLEQDRLDKNTDVLLIKENNIYGEFNNVKLSSEEYSKLILKLGESNTKVLIEELSGYMASKKTKYLNHYAVLLNWAKRKIETYKQSNKPKRTII